MIKRPTQNCAWQTEREKKTQKYVKIKVKCTFAGGPMLANGGQKRTDPLHPCWVDPRSAHSHRLPRLWRKLPVRLQHPDAARVSLPVLIKMKRRKRSGCLHHRLDMTFAV